MKMTVRFLTPCEGCIFEKIIYGDKNKKRVEKTVIRMEINGKEVCAIVKVYGVERRVIWCLKDEDSCLATFISYKNTSKPTDDEIRELIEIVNNPKTCRICEKPANITVTMVYRWGAREYDIKPIFYSYHFCYECWKKMVEIMRYIQSLVRRATYLDDEIREIIEILSKKVIWKSDDGL